MFTIKNEEVFRKKGRVNQLAYVFRLPDIGEGIHEGEVVKWLVEEGQKINEDDILCEIQNDKSVVELPSPVTGTVEKISSCRRNRFGCWRRVNSDRCTGL